jgi:hypothetical protein
MSLEQLMLLIRHESCLSSFHSCPHWLKALSLFDQQPKMEQQFLSQKFSIGLLSHKIMSLLAPTDQQISKFRNFLLTHLNRLSEIKMCSNLERGSMLCFWSCKTHPRLISQDSRNDAIVESKS